MSRTRAGRKGVRGKTTLGTREGSKKSKSKSPENEGRPVTRADCAGIPRPCPYVSCAHNLYLEISHTGGLKILRPDIEPHEMKESCVLDVAENEEGRTLEKVGQLLNVTRERVRQIEDKAFVKLRRRPDKIRALMGMESGPDFAGPDEPEEQDHSSGVGVWRGGWF